MAGLFDAITIGSLNIHGRMVKSSMVETLCDHDGRVTDALIDHYVAMAKGGVPMIITGASSFSRMGRGVPHQISLATDDHIAGLKRLTSAVQAYGCKIFIQIYHTGRQASPKPVGRDIAVAPSAVYEPTLGVKPKAMSKTDILETISEYAIAAKRAKTAGFDGVQIHAAHGYLISEFLTPHTNRRKDEYGGSFENRLRFLKQIVQVMRQQVGQDYPLIMKINGADDLPLRKGLSTSDLVQIAIEMEQEGIDAVEVTAGHYESMTTFERGHWKGYTKRMLTEGPGQHFHPIRKALMGVGAPIMDWCLNRMSSFTPAFNLPYAMQFKQALSIPVICVGGFSQYHEMDHALRERGCDMIGVARGLIANPNLYHDLKSAKNPQPCEYCNRCFTRAGVAPLQCDIYPVSAKASKNVA